MLVLESLLKRFLPDADLENVMHNLEHHLEVEVEEVYDLVPAFNGLVVGRVVEKKGKLYAVDTGSDVLLMSSLGSAELEEGALVPAAPVGSMIGDVTVKERKGAKGVIPTLSVLGIPDAIMFPATGGVPVFPPDVKPGTPLEDAFGMPQRVYDIYIAPPRGDLGSVWGFARELARVFGLELSAPEFPSVSYGTGEIVEVESLEDCPIYAGVLIRGVKITPSPWEFGRTLAYLGVRPINNIVDITNYFLTVFGQPMHAFDWDKIAGGKVIVRRARAGEKIVTLDGVERQLDEDILVIADAEKPIAIAGVMGGENSEVSETTKDIFLEVAHFAPLVVARSSRRLGLRTDASYRFERGTDPGRVSSYAEMATKMILEMAGGEVVSREKVGQEWLTKSVELNQNKANILLGEEVNWPEVVVSELGFGWEDGKVVVPSYRHDLNITEDIVDEVVKKRGYGAVREELPAYQVVWEDDDKPVLFEDMLKDLLARLGLTEVSTLSLIDPANVERSKVGAGPELLNPVSKGYSMLRPHLLPSLLEAQKGNESYGIYDVALFEVGKIFPDLNEQRQVGILVSGDLVISDWRGRSLPADFFVLKGMVEELLESLGAEGVRFEAMEQPPAYLHPYRSARILIGDEEIGEIGVVHPDVVEAWELRKEPVVAFLKFDALMRFMDAKRKARGIVRSPALWRDISMIVSKDMPISEVLEVIRASAGPYLEEVSVFDVFEDVEKLGDGVRSVAVRLVFRKPDGALSSEEADTIMEGIYKALEDMGVRVRR